MILCSRTVVIFLLMAIVSSVRADDIQLKQQIQFLDSEFKKLSSEYFTSDSTSREFNSAESIDMDQLVALIRNVSITSPAINVTQLIHLSFNTIKRNLEHVGVFTIIDFLLENNNLVLANRIFELVQNEGDQFTSATIQVSFAKYHAERNEWQQVLQLLDGIFNDLSEENLAYAYLLKGTAFQYLKLHRKAIENHSRVSSDSKYYVYAQLNTAIANIRQGWLTEARVIIKELIDQAQQGENEILTERLYLVLGYALLQKEYYRDARNAFRRISQESPYANRALLGIGLTATSQGDFIGGLNALTILQNKATPDLSTDESFLLLPFVYEKLQQELTATASYSQAINYYQNRLSQLDALVNHRFDFSEIEYLDNAATIVIENNSFDYEKNFPVSFIRNYTNLLELSTAAESDSFASKINKLVIKYDEAFQLIVVSLINQRREYLISYLNQSQYGLARLYDGSQGQEN